MGMEVIKCMKIEVKKISYVLYMLKFYQFRNKYIFITPRLKYNFWSFWRLLIFLCKIIIQKLQTI